MILEAVHLVGEGLRHPQFGVNAQLANVPRFGNDPPPPQIRRIYDAAFDHEAAIKPETLDTPCLIVRPNGDVRMTPEQMSPPDRFGDVPVLIRLCWQKIEAEQAFRNTFYIMRAIIFTLDWFNANAQSNSARSIHEVQLWAMKELTFGEFAEEVGDTMVTGAVACLWQTRDAHQHAA